MRLRWPSGLVKVGRKELLHERAQKHFNDVLDLRRLSGRIVDRNVLLESVAVGIASSWLIFKLDRWFDLIV